MKKITITLFVCFVALFLTTNTINGQSFYNARAFSMGGAYVGLADDHTAIFYNPAGLAHKKFIGFSMGATGGLQTDSVDSIENFVLAVINDDWQNVLTNLAAETELFIGRYGGSAGLRFGNFGFGVGQSGLGTILIPEESVTMHKETSYNLSYGYSIVEPFADIGSLSLGLSVKFLQGFNSYFSIGNDNVVTLVDKCAGKGLGADLGVMLKLSDFINLGLKVDNILSLYKWDDSEKESLPRIYTAGAAIKIPLIDLLAVADISNVPNATGSNFRLGMEKKFLLGALAIRAGLAQEADQPRLYTGGLGLNLGPVKADLGLGTDSFRFNNVSATIGLRVDF